MSKTTHGKVDVQIGDNQTTLNVTLKAVRNIEQRFGGIAPALKELQQLSVSSLALVIAIGSGKDYKRKDLEELEEEIFDAGINVVNPQVIPYLLAMLNPAGKSEEELERDQAAGNA